MEGWLLLPLPPGQWSSTSCQGSAIRLMWAAHRSLNKCSLLLHGQKHIKSLLCFSQACSAVGSPGQLVGWANYSACAAGSSTGSAAACWCNSIQWVPWEDVDVVLLGNQKEGRCLVCFVHPYLYRGRYVYCPLKRSELGLACLSLEREAPDSGFGHYFKIQISQISVIQQSTFLPECCPCCFCSPCWPHWEQPVSHFSLLFPLQAV